MEDEYPGIKGNIEIFSDDDDGAPHVFIHGDPEGLRSFAKLLIALAERDQNNISDEFIGFQEHVHLIPDFDISKSSLKTIVGRLDGAKTGIFPKRFQDRTKTKYRPAT